MNEDRVKSCCDVHANTVERLATLEADVNSLQTTTLEVKNLILEMRKDIIGIVVTRYPSTIIWVISLLVGFCTSLTTVLLGYILSTKG